MRFRDRLLATLRAVQPILDVRGVLVAGSEVPNLLEVDAASTLVVSQDVDLAIPIGIHEEVKARLDLIARLVPSPDEPSVWIPRPDAAELTITEQVKAVRARARSRRWEYRQRNLAHGAWARFRHALAHAREAYAIDDATAAALLAEGFVGDDRGRGLEPSRTLVWITAQRASELTGAPAVELRLGSALLAVRCLALVAFS